MTIKALKKFLKDKYPHIFRKTNIYSFHKCKIAIDASGFGHNYWYPMQSRVVNQLTDPTQELDIGKITNLWLNNIWSLIGKLLRLGITPVIVFDGDPPIEKSRVIKERQGEKKSAKLAIDEYLIEIKNLDPIMRNRTHLNHMKGLYNKWRALSWDQFQLLKIFFKGLGLPVLDATNEAEELCAELVRADIVSASFCEDIDSIAHLVPVWIYGKTDEKEFIKEREEYIESFEYAVLDEILKSLELNKESFVDLCIMCGSDYNVNIPNIGPAKSYELIKKYGNIDNIIANKDKINILKNKDLTILNHIRGRELFNRREYKDICKNPDSNLEIDFECIKEYSHEYLQKCEMEHLVNELDFIYAAFPRNSIKIDMNILLPKPIIYNIDINQLNIDFSNLDISKKVESIYLEDLGIDLSKLGLKELKM